jgi:hypothetical protein
MIYINDANSAEDIMDSCNDDVGGMGKGSVDISTSRTIVDDEDIIDLTGDDIVMSTEQPTTSPPPNRVKVARARTTKTAEKTDRQTTVVFQVKTKLLTANDLKLFFQPRSNVKI